MAGSEHSATEGRHSISMVSRRTGLSQLLLRAWERRYHAVTPARTGTGRRLYSDQDVERLTLLRILTEHDYRIGDVVTSTLEDLRELASEVTTVLPSAAEGARSTTALGPEQHLAEALEAIETMDSHHLESVMDKASVDLTIPLLRKGLIQPLLIEIGERWRQGTFRIAQEHMATAIVRTFLSSLNARQAVTPGSPVVAIAAPSGDFHEMGALLAASHALEVGWDVLYLGPNLPAEEMAAGVQARQARALFISLVYPAGDPLIGEQLRLVRRLLGAGFPIIAGGGAASSYQDVLGTMGAIWAPDPAGFDMALTSILG